MEIREIKGLNWPRQEKLRRTAKGRALNSNELLALKSRSFYLPISMLQITRGNDEINKRQIVTDLYNVLRYLDTIEDSNPEKINKLIRVTLIDNFSYIINQISRRKPIESIEDIVNNNLSKLTQILKAGVMDEDEKIFVEHFNKGTVLENIRANATRDEKEAIYLCTTSMATGMKRFLEEGKINNMHELNEYCSYVAGDVGIALNRIIEDLDKKKLDDTGAKTFGLSLQLTNVLKNIYEDWKMRKVVYLPKELIGNLSNEELFDIRSSRGKNVRESVLSEMISNTRRNLRNSIDYISSIPEELTGYQGFAMIPFLVAVETIRVMEIGGPEAVFSGKSEAIRISQVAFQNIAKFTYSLISQNGRKSREFMELYREAQDTDKHEQYCFDDKRFQKWTKDLF